MMDLGRMMLGKKKIHHGARGARGEEVDVPCLQ
jgi:hypothetical protein